MSYNDLYSYARPYGGLAGGVIRFTRGWKTYRAGDTATIARCNTRACVWLEGNVQLCLDELDTVAVFVSPPRLVAWSYYATMQETTGGGWHSTERDGRVISVRAGYGHRLALDGPAVRFVARPAQITDELVATSQTVVAAVAATGDRMPHEWSDEECAAVTAAATAEWEALDKARA
jgi:uncharacterized protein (DUF779 family)